jgi:hypothetical protein
VISVETRAWEIVVRTATEERLTMEWVRVMNQSGNPKHSQVVTQSIPRVML